MYDKCIWYTVYPKLKLVYKCTMNEMAYELHEKRLPGYIFVRFSADDNAEFQFKCHVHRDAIAAIKSGCYRTALLK